MHGKYLFGAALVFTLSMAVSVWADTPAAAATEAAAPATESPADKAWGKITDDLAALKAAQSDDETREYLVKLAGETKHFSTKFPDDAHALNATMLWAQVGQEMNAHGVAGGPPKEEIDQKFDQLATDAKVPKPKRAEIRARQIDAALETAAQGSNAADWDAVEKRFATFEKEFGADFSFDGQRQVLPELREMELQVLASSPDTARYDALVKKLAASPDPQIKAVGTQAQEHAKLLSAMEAKPLELKYTAVDGRAVDLAKLRGKVVLVDFWATWCPPCRAELPSIIAAYQKYHDKGFDIVGVSLDQDKDALQEFTKKNDMPWPQFFDGNGFQNEIAMRFGIQSIPSMFLVDKKGMIVKATDRMDLDAELPKLLAAP